MSSRSGLFYKEITTVTANYNGAMEDFGFQAQHLKIAVVGADVEFSLIGAQNIVDGKIKQTDGLVTFDGLSSSRIALKSSGVVTSVRVWAY